MRDPRADAARLSLVSARLPGPVRRGVVKGKQKGLALLPPDELHRPARKQVRKVTAPMHLLLAFVQIVRAHRIAMREIIDAAGERAEKLLVAALQRAEARREPQVPFANERGRVPRLAQQRSERRMLGRQPEHLAAAGA